MPETLTDEQILGLDDGPSSEVSSETAETSESTAPIETQPEATETESPLRPDQAKDETLAQSKQPAKAQQPDKTQQPAKDGTPEAQTIEAKAAELDRTDRAFLTGDYEGQYQTYDSLFAGNPTALGDAMWSARQYAQVNSPETLAMHDRMVVSEVLTEKGAVEGLQLIEDAIRNGDLQTAAALVGQYKEGLYQEFGIGPKTPEAQAEEWGKYEKLIGAQLIQDVDSAIRQSFGERLSSIQPKMQEELIKDARLSVVEFLRKDSALEAAFNKLREGYSHRGGAEYYRNALYAKARALTDRVVRNSINKNASIFKDYQIQTSPQTRPQPAQKPTQQTRAKPKSMAEYGAEGKTLGDITREVLGELDEANPLQAGSDEVNRMDDLEILGSNRAGRPRPKTRPENIYFDEAGA